MTLEVLNPAPLNPAYVFVHCDSGDSRSIHRPAFAAEVLAGLANLLNGIEEAARSRLIVPQWRVESFMFFLTIKYLVY
jgi:hypothetical protein